MGCQVVWIQLGDLHPVFECPREELNEVARVVQDLMENAYPLSIPLTTEARWGMNWDEMQRLA